MVVEVRIPAVFRKHVGGERAIESQGGTIKDVLDKMGATYPQLREELFGDAGDLHRFVNVYLNDEDVRFLEGLDTKVDEGDVVSILPAVAGGTEARKV